MSAVALQSLHGPAFGLRPSFDAVSASGSALWMVSAGGLAPAPLAVSLPYSCQIEEAECFSGTGRTSSTRASRVVAANGCEKPVLGSALSGSELQVLQGPGTPEVDNSPASSAPGSPSGYPSLGVNSMLSWMKGRLGFPKKGVPERVEPVAGSQPSSPLAAPVVLEEISNAPPTAWARSSHDFRDARVMRNSKGDPEMLRTSSEPPTHQPRRRRAREFVRNTDFYKQMADGDERASKRRSASLSGDKQQTISELDVFLDPARSSGEAERRLTEARTAAVQAAFQKARDSIGEPVECAAGKGRFRSVSVPDDFVTETLSSLVSTFTCATSSPSISPAQMDPERPFGTCKSVPSPLNGVPVNISQSAFFRSAPMDRNMGPQ